MSESDWDTTLAVYEEYYLCKFLLYRIGSATPLYRLARAPEDNDAGLVNNFITGFADLGSALAINQDRYSELLRRFAVQVLQGHQPDDELYSFVEVHQQHLADVVGNIPNSVDKARASLIAAIQTLQPEYEDDLYDAMVLMKESVPSATVDAVLKQWRREVRSRTDRHGASNPFGDATFWASALGAETHDAVSRFCFRDTFAPGEFPAAFGQVERDLSTTLLHAADPVLYHLAAVATDLWLVSRCPELSFRLSGPIEACLPGLAEAQTGDGSWLDPDSNRGTAHLTALGAVVLLRLSDSHRHHEQASRAANWLLDHQEPDGFWIVQLIEADGGVHKPSTFVTLLALEAIVRSHGIQSDKAVDVGISWILAQQRSLGGWEDPLFSDSFLTVLVLEFLERRPSLRVRLSPYLSTGKGFLNRAARLSLADSPNGQQLAIIGAFHGVETVLYGIFSTQRVNRKVYKSGSQTVGLREALNDFESYLYNHNHLNQGSGLPYRNDLDQLAHLRDEVVHKGLEVPAKTCQHLVRQAHEFCGYACRQVLQFDLFA